MQLTAHQLAALRRLERYSVLMPWWLAWELKTTGATMAALRRRGYVEADSDELLAKPGPAFYRITQAGHEQVALFAGAKLRVLGFLLPTDFRLATVGSNPAKYPELFAFPTHGITRR